MTTINRSAMVLHSAQQMYDLVNDVASYPEYMRGCKRARVISSSETELLGELTLSNGGMRQSFTTKNTMDPGRSIQMQLVEGPFSKFEAEWEFNPLSDEACKVTLCMEFEFSGGLLDFAMQRVFETVAGNQMDSILRRADTLYGIS